MKKIPLTQGQFALVDDEDFEWLNQWKWRADWSPVTKSFYAYRKQYLGGGRKNSVYKTVGMARLIMDTPEYMECDHINHDTLDNRRQNLRNVTPSQNSINRLQSGIENKSTGVRGVSIKGKGFRAQIGINGVQIHAPTRHTLAEAVKDRQQLEERYFGEYMPKQNHVSPTE